MVWKRTGNQVYIQCDYSYFTYIWDKVDNVSIADMLSTNKEQTAYNALKHVVKSNGMWLVTRQKRQH